MTEKIDYMSWSENSAEFLPKLRRVFQDINIRIASIEDTGRKLADIERRYGVVALERISDAITPTINEARALLAKVERDLADIDEGYRQNGQQRVDDIINPLIEQARQALEKTKTDLAAIDLAYRQEGQRRVDDIINPLLTQTQKTLADAEAALAAINAVITTMQPMAAKGQPDGYAALDEAGKVPINQLPALTTSTTVGAAIAAPTPSTELVDGDKVAGIGAGGAALKTWSFSVVKNWIKGWISKTDVNLGNVANKSESQMVASGAIADKFVAQQLAIDSKLPTNAVAADSAKLQGKTVAELPFFGSGQTWQHVSRPANTVFQNTTGRTIFITVNISSGYGTFQMSPDNVNWSTASEIGGGSMWVMGMPIPNGYYYKTTTGGTYRELR